MIEKLQVLLQQCEADIRAGNAQKAARLLGTLNSAEIPRAMLLPFANVARRAGCVPFGLRLLTPLIHSERNKWKEEANSNELAEYAVLLQYCGAVTEALQVLEKVDKKQVPQALLYRAFCRFNRWEYAEAIPSLEEYLKADLAPYASLVGRVNLAAALVASEQWDRATEVLAENIALAKAGGHSRLEGNCLELRGQISIQKQDFVNARRDLAEAASLLGAEATADQLYVRKWTDVVESLQSGSPEKLLAFRAEALARESWESVREADLFLLKVDFDPAAFDRLIFGTPYLSYRQRISKYLKRMPDRADFLFGDPNGRVFDLIEGSVDGAPALNAGKKIHQVIAVLMRDLYAPMKVGSLFAEVFPGDHFDINSSPDRLHQVLRRTRRWIEDRDLPLEIRAANGFYSLSIGKGLAVRVPLHRPEVSPHALDFEKLRRLAGIEFSPREAREHLAMSATSFNTMIKWGLERNLVARIGKGRAIRYRRVA